MEIIHVQFDELNEHMAPVHISIGPEPILMTPRQLSSRIIPNPVPAAPYIPPTNKDLDILFQLMFDKFFEHSNVERPVPPASAVQVPVVSAENGNAPIVTKLVDGKETAIPPTSVEEKAQRRAELKARSTLLMDLPNENQLKFNSYKDAKTLMNKPEIKTLSLDDLFNNLKAYESEVKGTSNSTTNSHNVAFLSSSSTNNAFGAVNTAQGVNTASTQDLQQIDPKDLEEMDLMWNIAMLTMRAKRFLKNTGRKLDMTNKERIRFDKSKCDGLGYDWSDQAEEGLTNFALMAYSLTSLSSSTNSEVSNNSKSCLESVEARLLVFKKNESVYEEDIKLLKHEIYLRDLDLADLKRKLELDTKEKDEIMDKCKTGLGYNAVPPPYTGNFMPPKSDLVYPSLDDFVEVNESVSESVVEKPTVKTNEPKNARKENRVPIIKDWVSESKEEDVPKIKTIEMFNKPSFAKINFVKSTKQVKSPRNTSVDKNRQNTPSPRGNKRNWNQ
ncbi:hypothetical protein Tco_0521727 [Tanacetum coccineum]